MSKGAETRGTILRQALELTSEVGLEGLTIGALAKQVGMSKSGLYAHFESKEALQCQVLDEAAQRFVAAVLRPALQVARGLPRFRAIFARWQDWTTEELKGGCPFMGAAIEFDDRPGPVRDRVAAHLGDVLVTIAWAARLCIEEGHFRRDIDIDQLAFELWATLQGYHHYARLLRRTDARERARLAFEKIVQDAKGS